jgi:phage tail protein X
MATTMMTKDGDTADAIALAAYGATGGATEALLAANPVLATQGPVLPAGLTLTLPVITTPATSSTVTLWD